METIRTAKDLKFAVEQMYCRLADFLTKNVDLSRVSVVLEAGCGRGQLTFPLAERMSERCKIIAFDVSSGPYNGALRVLGRDVRRKKLGEVIEVVGMKESCENTDWNTPWNVLSCARNRKQILRVRRFDARNAFEKKCENFRLLRIGFR